MIQEPPFEFFPLLGEIHGRVTRRTASAYLSPRSQGLLDRLPSMLKFGSKDDLACCIVNESQPRGLAAGIDLEPQRMARRLRESLPQNDGERVATKNRRPALREKQPRPSRVDRVKWFFVGIKDEYFTHVFLILLLRASGYPGNVGLVKVTGRFDVKSTVLTLWDCLTFHRRATGWPRTRRYLISSVT